MMDGTYTGTVDRIVDGETAVILLEADGEVVEEVTVPAEQLPAEAQDDGGVLSVELADNEVVALEYRERETCERRDRIRGKLDRLSERLSDRESGEE